MNYSLVNFKVFFHLIFQSWRFILNTEPLLRTEGGSQTSCSREMKIKDHGRRVEQVVQMKKENK